jgi:hypothetical protein
MVFAADKPDDDILLQEKNTIPWPVSSIENDVCVNYCHGLP